MSSIAKTLCRRALLAGAACAVASSLALPARAITVIDPTNLAQNILQVARAIEQINNQIRQIEQQAMMLATSPLQLSPQLAQSIASARQVLAAAQQVTFEANQVGESLKRLYPETYANFNLGDVLAQSGRWIEESRSSLEVAMRAEAQAAQSVDDTRTNIDAALSASQGAVGQTSAVQAGNQLLGVTAAQLAQIQTLLAAQGRALDIERMERLAREQRAAEIQRQAFPTQSNAVFTPARSAFDR